MKNSEIASAIIGSSFFAVPYLLLSVPILPSLAIGGAAFVAGELVLRKKEIATLKETNLTLYQKLENAKRQNKHIISMIKEIEADKLRQTLKEISDSVEKIIGVVETNPNKQKKVKNFFEYYLPVTVKLVDRFDEIENQKLSSKESKNFYETTENTLNKINDVFKQFLNNLYENDIRDTNVEVKVLNSMLKADGLDENEIRVKEDENE